MQDTELGLNTIENLFTEWRSKKARRNERMPVELMAQARSLHGRFPDKEICRVTGLTREQLGLPPKVKAKKSKPEFIEMPPVVAVTEPVVLEIRDGSRSMVLRLGSKVDIEQLLSRVFWR